MSTIVKHVVRRLPALRLGLTGAVLCLLAAGSYGVVHVVYGVRPAFVHVRWSASTAEAERQRVEERYNLTARAVREGRTFTYYLTDLSRANIQSLVRDPAIEDTHYLNREAFLVGRTAPRAAYTGWGAPLLPRTLDMVTILLLGTGLMLLGLCLVEPWLPATVRARLQRASLRREFEAARVFWPSEFAAAFTTPTQPAAGQLAAHAPFVLLAVAITIASLVGHTYLIDALPRGFYVDESSIAYNAHLIAQSGHDEHGVAWPLYFEAFGEYKNPLYIYLLALVYKCLGYSEMTTRLLSAFCWALGSGLTYLVARRLFLDQAPRLYLLLCLGFTPWLFSPSRISFELISVFPVLALFLLATYRAYEDRSPRWAVAAGAAIGLSIYAYSTFRLLAPLHALAVVLCFPQRRHWRTHCFFAMGVLLATVPYLVYTLEHFENLTQRFNGLTYLSGDDITAWDKVAMFASRYFGYFDSDFLATHGDPNRVLHTGYGGELLLPTVAMLVLGVLALLISGEVKKSGFARLLLCGLFIAPVAAALTTDTHHSFRAFSMALFAVLVSLYGVRYLVRWRLAGAIVALTAANAGLYAFHYFHEYPPLSAIAFENHGFREALFRARNLATGTIVVSDEGNQPYIDMLFFDSVLPDPRKVPVVLGNLGDLREGDVLIAPAGANDAAEYREGLVEGSLYVVRRFGR